MARSPDRATHTTEGLLFPGQRETFGQPHVAVRGPRHNGLPGSGGKGTIFINRKKAAEGRIEHSHGNVFSADETADVGVDEATPVTADYKEGDNKFTGKIHKVTIDLK